MSVHTVSEPSFTTSGANVEVSAFAAQPPTSADRTSAAAAERARRLRVAGALGMSVRLR